MANKENMSFEGWDFWEWFKGNQKSIKEIVKVGGPMLLGWIATHDPVWAGFASLVGKFIADTFEYWYKARKL